ncbi:MAG: hypothetical protein AAF666_19405 [Pseudomonadota bacterium]
MTGTSSTSNGTFGKITALSTWGAMFVAGFLATTAFDLWGQFLSPTLGFATLSPHGLARSLLGSLGLPNGNFIGYYVHFFVVGLIGYPIGWLFIFKPIWKAIFGQTHWFIPSAIYGFGLWVFAIGGITAIAGLNFFLGFTGITWIALVGHVVYGIVLAAVLAIYDRNS